MEDADDPGGTLRPKRSPGVLPVAGVLAGTLRPLSLGGVLFAPCYWCYKRGLCGHAGHPHIDL
jgi:hypothetical protein